jgi:hypothetical protein
MATPEHLHLKGTMQLVSSEVPMHCIADLKKTVLALLIACCSPEHTTAATARLQRSISSPTRSETGHSSPVAAHKSDEHSQHDAVTMNTRRYRYNIALQACNHDCFQHVQCSRCAGLRCCLACVICLLYSQVSCTTRSIIRHITSSNQRRHIENDCTVSTQ